MSVSKRLTPAELDVEHLALIRERVERIQRSALQRWIRPGDVVLDVAPQDHAGIATLVPTGVIVETLDIDPAAGTTYVADLCDRNDHIPSERFHSVFCTEVLEHTLQPFDAVAELRRTLRPGGHLILSCPFNFRIHGPLPDCWRFTEHGLRALLRDFVDVEIDALESRDRPLMPVHYTAVARKPAR